MADSTPEKESAGQDVSEVETADKDILSEMLTENIEKEFAEKEEPEEPQDDGITSEDVEVQEEDNAQDEAPPPEVEASEGEIDQEIVEETKETEEVPPLEAPQHWSAGDKQRFKGMKRDAQEWALERDKSMTADYTRKTQEIAQYRQALEPLNHVLAPIRPALQQSGISEAEYVARLMRADRMLQENPTGAIQNLAQNYGINLEALSQPVEMAQQPDPRLNALQQQVQSLQGYLQQNEARAAQENQAGLYDKIESFAHEKDESGDLKHPHFAKLRETMGHLMQSGAVGEDMKKAYTYALRLDDELYQQSLEAERTKIQKAEEKRRQEAIAKAKKVPTRRSSNPPAGSIQATDLDGVIGQTLDRNGY